MARTLDPTAHAARRDTILDAGQQLLAAHGHDAMTIDAVLRAVGISKGAFYHYFSSKDDLLQGILTRHLDRWSTAVAQAADTEETATERLRALAEALGNAKTRDRTIVIRALPAMFRARNLGIYARLRQDAAQRFLPIVTNVVADGAASGEFTVTSVEGTARVVMSLLQEYSQVAGQHLCDIAVGDASNAVLERDARAYSDAICLVLGMVPTTAPFIPIPDQDGWVDDLSMLKEEK